MFRTHQKRISNFNKLIKKVMIKKIVIVFSILVVFFIGCSDAPRNVKVIGKETAKDEGKDKHFNYNSIKVTRIVDGDTFEIESGEKVRLIGIDTPEKFESNKLNNDSQISEKGKKVIKKLGELSSLYSKKELLNFNIKLVPDSTNSDKDRYGRLLRYVFINDTILFNLQIIKDGYAYAYIKYPFIYMEQFMEAQRVARENKIGLWGDIDFKEMGKTD